MEPKTEYCIHTHKLSKAKKKFDDQAPTDLVCQNAEFTN
jgi:hypothetical protein